MVRVHAARECLGGIGRHVSTTYFCCSLVRTVMSRALAWKNGIGQGGAIGSCRLFQSATHAMIVYLDPGRSVYDSFLRNITR